MLCSHVQHGGGPAGGGAGSVPGSTVVSSSEKGKDGGLEADAGLPPGPQHTQGNVTGCSWIDNVFGFQFFK